MLCDGDVYLQKDAADVSQFDSKFTKQTPIDSPEDDSMLSESVNQVFQVNNQLLNNQLPTLP